MAGCAEIEPGMVLGSASAPLLRVPLDSVDTVDSNQQNVDPPSTVPGPTRPLDTGQPSATCTDPFVHTVHESASAAGPPVAAATPSSPPADLLKRLTAEQRASFIKLWDKLPPHLRDIKFDLHGEGWTPAVIDQLGTVLFDYQDVFSTSPTDLGSCPLLPFKIVIVRILHPSAPSRTE